MLFLLSFAFPPFPAFLSVTVPHSHSVCLISIIINVGLESQLSHWASSLLNSDSNTLGLQSISTPDHCQPPLPPPSPPPHTRPRPTWCVCVASVIVIKHPHSHLVVLGALEMLILCTLTSPLYHLHSAKTAPASHDRMHQVQSYMHMYINGSGPANVGLESQLSHWASSLLNSDSNTLGLQSISTPDHCQPPLPPPPSPPPPPPPHTRPRPTWCVCVASVIVIKHPHSHLVVLGALEMLILCTLKSPLYHLHSAKTAPASHDRMHQVQSYMHMYINAIKWFWSCLLP